jgi:hypothetical protein
MRNNRRRFLKGAGLAAVMANAAAAGLATGQTTSTGVKRRGIAMTIGLNHVDLQHYPGAPPLRGCINDAKAINEIARLQRFECERPLVDQQATASAVIAGIRDAARELKSGDIFLIQYSGHGGQVPDRNGDESDGMDETWCLYDRMLIDDELARLWTEFAAGVRILMISDSCHSGTMARGRGYVEAVKAGGVPARGGDDKEKILQDLQRDTPAFRFMPDEVLQKAYQQNKDLYDRISDDLGQSREGDDEAIKASVVLISGCQDNQLSGDLRENGLFTKRLLQVWADGKFNQRNKPRPTYQSFHAEILSRMPDTQSPNFYSIGQPDLRFWTEKPFTP